jgi:Raf kinase inhibitor-like YbhB/YbcL family protein
MGRELAVAAILLAAMTGAQLRSADFSSGGTIPIALMARDCGGANRSPVLSWQNVPRTAKSFALIVHDADAPIAGGFYHWVVYNLPPTVNRLASGAKLAANQVGQTSLGKPGYYGPCPPPGQVHHYVMTLYALDLARIATNAPLTGPQLERRIAGHVLTRATLEATASRR